MKCANCGKEIINNNDFVISVKNGERIEFFCKKCASTFGTCAMCVNCGPCVFFESTDPMPQFVMARREQKTPMGMIIEQYQMPNPDRVKRFCIDDGCKCYHEVGEKPLCCRLGGPATCTNYVEKEQFNFVQDFSKQEAIQN